MSDITWKAVLTLIVFGPLLVAMWAGYRGRR